MPSFGGEWLSRLRPTAPTRQRRARIHRRRHCEPRSPAASGIDGLFLSARPDSADGRILLVTTCFRAACEDRDSIFRRLETQIADAQIWARCGPDSGSQSSGSTRLPVETHVFSPARHALVASLRGGEVPCDWRADREPSRVRDALVSAPTTRGRGVASGPCRLCSVRPLVAAILGPFSMIASTRCLNNTNDARHERFVFAVGISAAIHASQCLRVLRFL